MGLPNTANRPPSPWTPEQKHLLRELYTSTQRRELMALLDKTFFQLKTMARSMGLKKREPGQAWRPEDLQVMHALYPAVGAVETALALGRTVLTVKAQAYRLRLRMATNPRALPLGTERVMYGETFRKVSMDKGFLQDWQRVSVLEQNPELRELYRLLTSIRREVLAKQNRQSQSSGNTC